MYFLFSARDANGAEASLWIKAANSQQAVERVTQLGYKDVILKMENSDPPVQSPIWTAKDSVKAVRGDPNTVVMMKLAAMAAAPFLILSGVTLYFAFVHGPLSGPAIVGYILIPVIVFGVLQSTGAGRQYRRLVNLIEEKRWNEALRLARRINRNKQVRSRPAVAFGIDVSIGQALAGLGRLDEALQHVEASARAFGIDQARYLVSLAPIYRTAKDYDRAVDCYRKAIALSPDPAQIYASLAQVLVQRNNDPDGALEALEKAKAAPLPDFSAVFLLFTEGMIAFEKRAYLNAKQLLTQALAQQQRFRAMPYMRMMKAWIQAYLAMSHIRLGERAEAKRYLAQAEPFLRRCGEEELADRCRNELA